MRLTQADTRDKRKEQSESRLQLVYAYMHAIRSGYELQFGGSSIKTPLLPETWALTLSSAYSWAEPFVDKDCPPVGRLLLVALLPRRESRN